jgi:two-component system chemotaxis response regulator CheB
VVVVQEIAPQILPAFVKQFNEHVPWNIEMAQEGQIIEQGVCYICSNEHALTVERNENGQACLRLSNGVEKPLNQLFHSAAETFKKNTIGVMLTGVGDDGADGFAHIREHGGVTIAQDMQCCVYPNLTQNAIEMGTVTTIADETQMPKTIESSIA